MDDQTMNDFLGTFYDVMLYGAIGFAALALILYIGHIIGVSSRSDFKKKYDFLREKEIRNYRRSFYLLAVSVFMVVNLYSQDLKFDIVWFAVRLFIGFAVAVLFGYVAKLVLMYYYPSRLDKKLKKWRYKPRYNNKTGNKMRLLSEDEEDVHLDEGMQAEEEAFSIDYDVWIDEETGDVKIEKYPGHLQAVQCGNCGFYTMKVQREEITKEPTENEEGELIKHYECGYCGSIRATQFNIAMKREDVTHLDPSSVKFEDKRLVASISVEIIATDGHKLNYDFQNLEQATSFLEEFDYEKVAD